MKKNLFAILMLTVIIFSASCTKDDVEVPTLQLSENGTITLPKATSEKAVTVTTNQSEWTAVTNADWVELTQSGTTLTIKTGENLSLVVRTAEVTVLAGGIGRKLKVEQAESDLTIVTFPDKLEINQWGGTFQFDVDANTDDWIVTSNAEWVRVTPKQFKKEVVIEIEENTAREERTATLTISGGGNINTKEFIVTQQGTLFYTLPYFSFGKSINEINYYEESRRSMLIGQPDGFLNLSFWDFKTISPAFDLVRYDVGEKGLKQIVAFMLEENFVENELDGFKEFLISKGFEKESDNLYINMEKKLQAELAPDATNPHVLYTKLPLQPQEYKTWDKFPWGFVDFNKRLEGVEEYEAENGGQYNEGMSGVTDQFVKVDWYDIYKSPLMVRFYLSDPDSKRIHEAVQIYDEPTLVLYNDGSQEYFTKEFTELYKTEGLVFLFDFDGWFIFAHPESGRDVIFRTSIYPEFEKKTVLDFRVSPPVELGGSELSVPPYLLRDPDFEAAYNKIKLTVLRESALK